MKQIIKLVYIFLCLGYGHTGTCPKYPLIRDFDFKRYLGMWYQQDKKQSGWELPGRCWKSLYMRDPKNGQYKMRMIFENTITRREEEYDSQISIDFPERPSVIKYTIPLTFLDDEFQILATDYTTFSVEYKCDPNGLLEKQESVFLLTRDQNPPPLVLQKAYAIMHRYGIDIRKLERVDQTCGGMRLASHEAVDEVSSADYNYYQNQDQDIQDTGYHKYYASEESFNERDSNYDYYERPSRPQKVITAAPKIIYGIRRPIVKRRTIAISHTPTDFEVSFGAQLAERLRRFIHSFEG
ncbi:UNVERIFIED_CONTAM: hypothetical protein RMT77_013639 [Armadillidium vulgare]